MTNTPPDDRRALLASALEAIDDLQEQLDEARAGASPASTEPIAIVGLSCRYPGGANSPEEYWDLLRNGRDVISEFPSERRALVEAGGVDVDAFDDDATWYGGFLDQIDEFDPQFFGVSPREAATMDPQQRLVLELSWEALERAAIAPDSLNGSATGVFVGITGNDYIQLAKLGGSDSLDVYSATGGALNAAPGRVAYTLGLQGPSMAIDTACSSSLVALHQACRSLRSGETDLALAGGVNLLLLPEAFVCFNQWGMMAGDGRCKTFDAAADGFVRGEGCGMVVVKRLSDAEADGDEILAVVRGSAVNQDGRSSGLTVPSGLAQQQVVRQALDDAGVDPADVQYFEAHGTGTTLGDPIEIEAMGAVLGTGRPGDRAVIAGSVKTNIGHTESASGIAGVIKVVLSMQHGQIPPHLHFQEPSPQIPWPRFPVVVPTELMDWEPVDGRRLAGVSGFGFSGTNAHVVLESPPAHGGTDDRPARSNERRRVLALSARTDDAVRDLAASYASWISERPDLSLADICTSTDLGRARMASRLAIVASTPGELVERLESFVAADRHDPADLRGVASGTARRPRVAFMFTGQGSQYPGMARGLYDDEPVFRAAMDECAALMDPQLPTPLLDVVFAPEGSAAGDTLAETGFTQPALFAVEYSLASLWTSWGVEPELMLGHSVGEIAAAAIAGVFSLTDAVRLVVARGRLMQSLPAGGAMIAVSAPLDVVETEITGRDDVAIAAVNAPTSTVVSGAGDSIATIAQAFEARDIKVQELVVSHAFHSPLMRPMLDEFRSVASSISYTPPTRRMISNVSGSEVGDEIATADYWVDHVMAPVRFADGMAAAAAAGIDAFVEVGPHPVLTALGRVCVPDDSVAWVPSLRRNHDDDEQILGGLGALFAVGVGVDWSAVAPAGRRITLPTYPFQRTRCWLDPAPRRRRTGSGGHPLVSSITPAPALGATIHESVLAADAPHWLVDHHLSGAVVFPDAAFAELVAAAAGNDIAIDSLTFIEPLAIAGDREVVVQTVVTGHGGDRQIQIHSVDDSATGADAAFTTHATATVRTTSHDAPAPIDIEDLVADHPDEIDTDGYYAHLRSLGLGYGPTFRPLTRLHRGSAGTVGFLELPGETTDAGDYALHPALLDACFHLLGVAVIPPGTADAEHVYVPGSIGGMQVWQAGAATAWCHVVLDDGGAQTANSSDAHTSFTASVSLHHADGATIATIDRLELRRTPRTDWERSLGTAVGPVYDVVWRDAPQAESEAVRRDWLIVAGDADTAAELTASLEDAGASCTTVADHADDAEIRRSVQAAADAAESLGVVYLRGVDAEIGAGAQLADYERSLGGALVVAQTLAENAATDSRLFVVTGNGQSVDGEPSSPEAASLWGFTRVVANEHPALAATVIDIGADSEHRAELLASELLHADGDDQVALRAGRRCVPRLVSVNPRDLTTTGRTDTPVRNDGSYVVTGGLGGIGLAVAEWLGAQGARSLTLAGRSTPSATAESAIASLRASGVSVDVVAADVSRPVDVDRLLAAATADGRPLRGVFHAAGVNDDGALGQQTWDRFEHVLAPKAIGASMLDRATRSSDLDHFVLFSSASAVLGAPGQSNYAAANSALDAIASERRHAGFAALSVNWGAWAGAGMAAALDDRERQRMADRGVLMLSTADALAILGELLDVDASNLAVVEADWSAMFSAVGGTAPAILSELGSMTSGVATNDVGAAPTAGSLVDALVDADPAERPGIAADHVAQQVARVLGLAAAESVEPGRQFAELGMDSLMAVELTNRLRISTGLALEATLALEYPTVDDISAHLSHQLDRVVTLKAKLASMSPEEVSALLAARRKAAEAQSG